MRIISTVILLLFTGVAWGNFQSPEKILLNSGDFIHMLPLKASDFGLLQYQACKESNSFYPILNNYKYSNMKTHLWWNGEEEFRFRLAVIKYDHMDYFMNQILFKSYEACRNAQFGMRDIQGIRISVISPYDWGKDEEHRYLRSIEWNLDTAVVKIFTITDDGELKLLDKGSVVKWANSGPAEKK